MKIFRILNIVFCAIAVFIMILYVNLGKVVDSFLDPEYIKGIVNKKTGLTLELIEPKINTTKDFNLNLKAKEISLSNKNEPLKFLYTKEAEIQIEIFPLMVKKIKFNKLVGEHLEINLERYKDGSFNFEKYLNKNSKFPFKLSAKNASVLINDYNLNFDDKKAGVIAKISGGDLVSTEFNLDNYADIKTKGEIILSRQKNTSANRIKQQVSPYALDLRLKFPISKNLDFKDSKVMAKLSNLDFSYIYPYVLEFIPSKTIDIRDFKGKASITVLPYNETETKKADSKNTVSLNPLEIDISLEDALVNIFKNNHNNYINIKGKSTVKSVLAFKNDEILIKDFHFTKPGVNLWLKGSVKNFKNGDLVNNLNPDVLITAKDSSLKALLEITPDYLIKLQQDYIPNLKKFNANANVNAEFKLKDRLRFPNMYGFVKLDDVYLLERPKNAKTASADILFDGSDVDISVLANCPNNEKIIVKGKTEIKALPKAEFDINSTKNIDMAFAHKILIPIHEIFGFQLGPLPFMKIAGTGEISLNTSGTRESASLNGYFKTNNGEAELDGLNTRLSKGKIKIVFNGKKIIFDGAEGVAEGAKVKIDGSSDVLGNLDLYVKIFDVEAKKALNVVKTSDMILSLLNGGGFLDAYTNPVGNIDFSMRLWGKASEYTGPFDSFEPNDDMKAKGTILFKNNSIDIFPEIKATKVNGTLDFTDFVTLNLNADVYSSPFTMTGTVKPDTLASKNRAEQPQIVDLTFKSKNATSADLYRFFYDNQEGFQSKNKISDELYTFLNKIKFKFATSIRLKGKVAPDDAVLDMKKFTLEGWAVGLNNKESDILFNSGLLRFKDQKIIFKDLKTTVWNADILTNGTIDKIFDDVFIPDLNFKLLSFPFEKVTDFKTIVNDKNFKKVMDDFSDFKGVLNGEFFYNQEGFRGNTNFNQVSLYDKKRDLPVFLNSGDIRFSGDDVKLNALNMSYGHTPVYIDAVISGISQKKAPDLNVYLSTNLNEESLDKLLNPMLQFPLKTKGEFTLKGRLKGQIDNYTTYATVILNPGCDISYMGANLGDVSNKREISSRIDFKNDEIEIKNLNYLKYILSQNNKETPYEMLKISGGMKMEGEKPVLDNLKIDTPNPAPAKLLNPVFKKSVLKQGTMSANILLNGPVYEPRAKGEINFSNVDIPLYKAQIRDVRLKLKEDLITAVFEGASMGSDIKLVAEIVNKPTLPVIINKAEISSKTINLNNFIEGLSGFARAQKSADPTQKQAVLLSATDFEIKDGKITADEILYNTLRAQNFSGTFKHTPGGVFIFNDIVFDVAGGKIKTNGSYEFETTQFTINSEIKDCDANTLVTDILGTKNQIFGKTNGKINLSGRELNTAGGINTVKANVDFAIYDGKMPKLGSLEYLLRAGNLVKSGILGFTINNVIEVLIPYKTGEFKQISGDFIVEDGKIDKLNIYSKGDNLSIYTSGNYDIGTNVGDFEVLGKLSTKISNLLGPVGNASVNSLVNIFTNNKFDKEDKENIVQNADKIPDISGSSSDFRLFAVKILGDLNADNFVKSFNWLN